MGLDLQKSATGFQFQVEQFSTVFGPFLGNLLAMIAPCRYSLKIFLLILRHVHAKIVARQQKIKNPMSMD